MTFRFTKMHGTGNDYVYVNGFEQEIENPGELSIRISDRHFGIGSDGLILIVPSKVADCRMRMYNADGSEGAMCGNGIRCVAKYAYEHGIVHSDRITVETQSGIKTLDLTVEDGKVTYVKVNMGVAVLEPARIPVTAEGDDFISQPLVVDGKEYKATCVSMGNPHAVTFLDGVEDLDLPRIGPLFESHPLFPERVNTEFVRLIDRSTIAMRVWERGNGETMACGTGACAAAVAAVVNGFCDADTDITVRLLGGDLTVRVSAHDVVLTGSAVLVFEGEFEY